MSDGNERVVRIGRRIKSYQWVNRANANIFPFPTALDPWAIR